MWVRLAQLTIFSVALVMQGPTVGAGDFFARKEKITEIGVFTRPTVGDIDLIDTIAEVGAPLTMNFKAGTDLIGIVIKKCGQPSVTMPIHPEYERLLVAQNASTGLTRNNLANLPSAAKLEIPACATFAKQLGEISVPHGGLRHLEQFTSIPFDYEVFVQVLRSPRIRRALLLGDGDKFRKTTAKLCGIPEALPQAASLVPYLSCINAATVAAANPELTDPVEVSGTINVPIAGRQLGQSTGEDDVPLRHTDNTTYFHIPSCKIDADPLCGLLIDPGIGVGPYIAFPESFNPDVGSNGSPGFGLPPNIHGLKGTKPALEFVTELNSPEGYTNCANAAELHPGAWPFDVAEFQRAANLSDIEHSPEKGKILIADTGFDFTGDPEDQQVASKLDNIFPRFVFHVLTKELDPDPNADQNQDGVNGNGGWAGVNLAATTRGDVSARTNVNDDSHRGHGLAVTTLALGGRGIEDLRKRGKLDLEVGEASLVPEDNPAFIDSNFVTNTIRYAQADGNHFGIINLSLTSNVKSGAWSPLTNNLAPGLLVVVAAGNDGQQLTAEKGVWPAAFGGVAVVDDATATEFVTVGSSNGGGGWAEFSNWGTGVDVLAPGCVLPSYKLKTNADGEVIGIADGAISGTSGSAPLVSFVAALLAGNFQFHDKPGAIKDRIQISTDYDYGLQARAYSSGILNVAKAIGFKHDILEVIDNAKRVETGHVPRKLRYGVATITSSDGLLKCGYEPPVSLASIKKIARSKNAEDPILILAADDATKRMKLDRYFCPPSALDELTISFQDIEMHTTESVNVRDLLDYIASKP